MQMLAPSVPTGLKWSYTAWNFWYIFLKSNVVTHMSLCTMIILGFQMYCNNRIIIFAA